MGRHGRSWSVHAHLPTRLLLVVAAEVMGRSMSLSRFGPCTWVGTTEADVKSYAGRIGAWRYGL
jgi:hypothetical protein